MAKNRNKKVNVILHMNENSIENITLAAIKLYERVQKENKEKEDMENITQGK